MRAEALAARHRRPTKPVTTLANQATGVVWLASLLLLVQVVVLAACSSESDEQSDAGVADVGPDTDLEIA